MEPAGERDRAARPGRARDRGAPATGGADLKKILVVGAQIVATVVVTWFVASRAGLTASELRSVDLAGWDLSLGLLVGSCVALAAGYLGTGALWGVIVRGLGGPDLGVGPSVRMFMVANLGRYVPGKVWQIAGLVALSRGRGVAGPTAAAAAVLNQGVSLAGATLVGLVSLWTLTEAGPWRWAVPVLSLGAVALGLLPPVFRWLVARWFGLARTEVPDGLTESRAAGWLALALGTWLVYGGAFWLLAAGLGQPAGPIAASSAFAAAYVLGYVMIFAPAGLGVREGFLVALLAPQMGVGPAGAVALIARLWTTVIEVVPATVFWGRHLATTATTRAHE